MPTSATTSGVNWKRIGESSFPWEREALELVERQFPTHEPWRAWSNFEFIAEDGNLYEVDLMVFGPRGWFLVEIKSWPGRLSGDVRHWQRTHDGRTHSFDNPRFLAETKAKKLASLLQKQAAARKARLPFLEALTFLSAEDLDIQLPQEASQRVCTRATIMQAITRRECPGLPPELRGDFNKPTAKVVSRAIEQAGIRPSTASHRVGDYVIKELVDEGPGWQDFAGEHASLPEVRRLIRIYGEQRQASEADRKMLRRAAEREFRLLQALDHPSIHRVMDFSTACETGPALLFDYLPKAVRLDHYLASHQNELTDDLRLDILRQIAEALQYAHGRRIYHRSLSPQNVLLVPRPDGGHRVVLGNWRVASRADSTTSGPEATFAVTATIHAQELTEAPARAYLAPELASGVLSATGAEGSAVDIFSLGAIAFELFAGRPPAQNHEELIETVKAQDGLRLSSVVNSAPSSIEELIAFSTAPLVHDRYDSVRDFLEQLEEVEDELSTPENQHRGNPADAEAGMWLQHGLKVKRRIGSGSCATALLVERDGSDLVLKVARDTRHNARLNDEAEVLQKLTEPVFVRLVEKLDFDGHVGLLMHRAGDETLRDRIGKAGLSIDQLEALGGDLLEAVDILEQKGLAHRDIKPENIGVGYGTRKRRNQLVLFDFSLSRENPENIRAGTPAFLDPFLNERKSKRWDTHAERYAAAVTLHQMATNVTTAIWGDGNSLPELLPKDAEPNLSADRFDTSVAEPLTAFFARALARRPADRFDNAREMREAWTKVFSDTRTSHSTHGHTADEEEVGAKLDAATFQTPVAELGLGPAANGAMDRNNVITVADLLRYSAWRMNRWSGVSNAVRKQINDARTTLHDRLGTPPMDLDEEPPAVDEQDQVQDPSAASLDTIVHQLFRKQGKRSGAPLAMMRALFGLEDQATSQWQWPSQQDAAAFAGVTRGRVSQVLNKEIASWVRKPVCTALRETVAQLIHAQAGVVTVRELARLLIAARGTAIEEPARSRYALAAARVAVEVEKTVAEPAFAMRRAGETILVGTSDALFDAAVTVGDLADRLCEADPLLSGQRVIAQLRTALEGNAAAQQIPDDRLLKLAAAASTKAALSSRQELYPIGMSAARAMQLSAGAIRVVRDIQESDLRKRVKSRYPLAEDLPPRPLLDDLVREAGLDLAYDEQLKLYVSNARHFLSLSSSETRPSRQSTQTRTPVLRNDSEREAARFDDRLDRLKRQGGLLAMTVPPPSFRDALKNLRRFEPAEFDLEACLARSLRAAAEQLGIAWSVILKADAADRHSQDWNNLCRVIREHVLPAARAEILRLGADRPVLLLNANWLDRYGLVGFLSELRQAMDAGQLHGLWLLIPQDGSLPRLDHSPVPLVTPNERAQLDETWIKNLHRGQPRSEIAS